MDCKYDCFNCPYPDCVVDYVSNPEYVDVGLKPKRSEESRREYRRAYAKKYYEEHREKLKKYRDEHKEKQREYMKRYRAEHREELRRKQEIRNRLNYQARKERQNDGKSKEDTAIY